MELVASISTSSAPQALHAKFLWVGDDPTGASSRRQRRADGIFLPHVHPVLLMNPLNIPSSGRHFYLAVDHLQFKMRTLLELLGVVFDRHDPVPIAICVSSRDELDAVCAAVANLPFVSLSPLYNGQDEAERASVLEKSRRAAIQRNQIEDTSIDESPKPESVVLKLHITVVTDACLPSAAMGEAPLMPRVLINYELPTKKEAYLRRVSACLATDGIVINMVVGGEVALLRSLEETSGFVIAEMPIHVSEIL